MAGAEVRESRYITIEEIHGQVKVRANDINLGAKILNSMPMSAIPQCPHYFNGQKALRAHQIRSLDYGKVIRYVGYLKIIC